MKKTYGNSYVEVRRYITTNAGGKMLVSELLDEMGKSSKRAGYRIARAGDAKYLLTFECDIFEYELIQRKLAENNYPYEKVERISF